MPAVVRLREASELDRVAYRARLRRILDSIDNLNDTADRDTIALFAELRRNVVAHIADLGDTPSATQYQRARAGIDETITAWAERFGVRTDELADQGFALGEELVTGPLADAGAVIDVAGLGVTTDQARILGQFRADLIGGVTDDLRRRITVEIAGVATGAATVSDAVKNIGRNLTDRNHFSTITHRARAIVVTEVGRAQALATQASQTKAAEQIPGLRKRWINAHLPGARTTHLAVESATAPGGDPGPIPIDGEFTVNGTKALYPRDPSLPASESVNCHCVSVTVITDTVLADPLAPLTANDEARAATQ